MDLHARYSNLAKFLEQLTTDVREARRAQSGTDLAVTIDETVELADEVRAALR
ncbi:MAG: hypothetical protein ACT4PT_05790 [Methanobacteriota archaeon]